MATQLPAPPIAALIIHGNHLYNGKQLLQYAADALEARATGVMPAASAHDVLAVVQRHLDGRDKWLGSLHTAPTQEEAATLRILRVAEIELRRLLAPATAGAAQAAWRDMSTAPKDGTLLRLLVEFEHHATEDAEGPQITIGSNTWDNHHDFDEWQFAGWNWEQDCYTQGIGKPVGWLPILDAAPTSAPEPSEPDDTPLETGEGDAR